MRLRQVMTTTILFGLAISAVCAETFYKNDFESGQKVTFKACVGPWISSLKKAQDQGFIKINAAKLSTKKFHNGRYSFVIDIKLDKSTTKWGGSCMWKIAGLKLALNRPIIFRGFVFCEKLPADMEVKLGVLFTALSKKTGKAVKGGIVDFKFLWKDDKGWLVFNQDITEMLNKKYKNVIVKDLLLVIRSRKAFHGQQVKIYVDDVAVMDKPQMPSGGTD